MDINRIQGSKFEIQEEKEQGKKASGEAILPEPPILNPESSKESGGPKGPEPTRYGDWEINGKCVDF